jgi:hypothetical protein
MLRGTIAFLTLVAFAVASNEVRKALLSRGLRAPALEGPIFLAIGYALGDKGMGLFPADLLVNLDAVVLLGLAWIGLVFGLQLDISIVWRLRPWHCWLGLVVPLVVGLVVLVLGLLLGISVQVVVGLSAIAMVASPATIIGLARIRRPVDRATMRLLKLVMAFAGLPAIITFAVVSPHWFSATRDSGQPMAGWQLLITHFFQIGVGIILGYALIALARGITDRFLLLTVIAGTLAAVAGATTVLGLSPLPAAAISGAIVMNRCIFPHRILSVAHSFEMPMVIALLVVAGASWTGVQLSWPVFALMVIGRFAGMVAGGAVMEETARRQGVKIKVPLPGCGLLPQGELAVGLLVAMIGIIELQGVLEAVVAAMVVNQIAGQWWLRRYLMSRPSRGMTR